MHNNYKSIAVAVMMAFTTGCVSTTESTAVDVAIDTPASRVVHPQIAHAPKGDGTITLEQIMADPQWLGRQPTNAHWSVDGEVVYQQERENSKIKSLFSVSPNDYTTEEVPFSEYYLNEADELVSNLDGSLTAWRYQDSLFVKDAKGQIRQLTKGEVLKGIAFTTDNRLMGQVDDKIVVIDLDSGFREQLVSWSFAKAPTPVNKPKDYVAREQQALIQYIAKGRTQRTERFERDQALDKASPASASSPFYFDPSDQMIAIKASPAGDYAIAVTAPQAEYRDDSDIMPHYIQEDGRIAAKPVRQRVADATPRNHDVWLLNLKTGEKSQLSYHQLPGYNDDVLAEVKRENAAVHGDDYQVNRLPREITLLSSWYWSEPSIRWHKNGGQVALMLEAWDNKDRWITTVDFDRQQLVNQHRLHDDAWVNYRFNQFGWLSHSNTLFYQSEHSGYSHLYTQLLGEAPKAVTQGDYIVDDIHISADDQWVYYTANKAHPGLYEVYRSELSSGKQERLTELNGKTEFSLSPDETTLLLTHSKVNHPAELYLAAADGRNQTIKDVAQITDTVSDTFTSFEWAIPQIVAIESSHTDQPIYARVYLPQDYQQGDARRAVVFNHGAGYLQNAHLGWSGYFREYMFHSMLVQQGYVVLDMDYRASAGYGRDWRTAIYRQMGTPEVQDLQDGVNWLVENANVDRNRIGTYGGSYGGFLTFMSMFTQPDLFQAGAALRPVTDWAHYNTPYTANILNTPDVDPIAYRRSSPIYFAEGLEKPLLINAPMVDDNVFFVDVVRLVQRLIELEKQDFETAIYPVEPHGFVQPSSWLDEYRRIYKLFEQHL